MLTIQLSGLTFIFIFFISSLTIYRNESEIFFIFLLITCSFSDIGGFIFGNIIGGKKLTKISPNKTIAGSVGSFIFSVIPLIIFNTQNYLIFNFNLSIKYIIFCLIISLSNQLGDLFISYFKRLEKIKDTGKILPGHGGIFDRIDGLMFVLIITIIFYKINFLP